MVRAVDQRSLESKLGEKNTFRMLKQFALKEVSFKQGKALRAIVTEDQNRPKGVCAALAWGWLAEKLHPEGVTLPAYQSKEQASANYRSMAEPVARGLLATAKAIPLQQDYLDSIASDGQVAKAIELLANKLNLKITFQSTTADFTANLDKLKKLPEGTGAYVSNRYTALDGTLLKDAHALAFYRGNGFLSFYDPNLGSYMLFDDLISSFFRSYRVIHRVKHKANLKWSTYFLVQ